jgi:hypothetical protein
VGRDGGDGAVVADELPGGEGFEGWELSYALHGGGCG